MSIETAAGNQHSAPSGAPDPIRLSVIVCAHNIEGFISECIESLFAQDYEDVEIITINDGSTDSTGDLLDELAAGDDRLHVTHLTENVGLGMARNIGLTRARGEYVVFLDGDDTMTSGALRAIANRLAETDDPDVLLYDYERTYWWGAAKRNRLSALLTKAGDGPCTLDDYPELLRIFPVAWNKAYRRDYLAALGLQFSVGYYEDISWTFLTLILATKLATLDRVCVLYRQRRFGGILQTCTDRHIDVIEQYETVFNKLRDIPALRERWIPVVHRQMVNHLLSIWEHPKRLPREFRPEFFRRASEHARSWVPSRGFEYSSNRRQAIKQWLLLHDRRRTLQTLQAVARARRAVQGRGKTAQRQATRSTTTLRRFGLRLYYRLQRQLPLDPQLAVYSSYWHAGYLCNPRAIYEKAAELLPAMRGVWVIRAGGHPAPLGTPTVRPDTRAYWRALARASYFVNNVNFPDEFVKRPGTIHLQTQHGTPLKYMGIHLRDRPAASGGTNMGNLLRRSDRWDFNLSANPYSSRIWQRAFPCDYEMLEYGYPRNDRLVAATDAETARVRELLGIPGSSRRTVILYAPTHREFDRQFVSPLDIGRFAGALGPDYIVLVRCHHKYVSAPTAVDGSSFDRRPAAQVIDVSGHPTIEDLCIAADVLITDYSSVMFDFANLNRPIVLFIPDWEAYRMVRGVYFDVVAQSPGMVTDDPDQLVHLLQTGAHADAEARARLAAFRQWFCPFDDGHAAERVVRRVFLGERPTPTPDCAPRQSPPESEPLPAPPS